MGNNINIDGQPIEVEPGDTVADLKYKAGVDDDEIMWGSVDGELMPLNDEDSADMIEDNQATTMPGGDGTYYG